ncbi:MAG TPA: fructosamine kinase family protein [Anaerolineales bacterium]|nr:fructosamine kinase family protein [Anaerolineales bacterium]
MRLAQAALDWLREHDFGEVTSAKPISGGCINQGMRLLTSSGQTIFLKQNSNAAPDMFQREEEGLRALAVSDGPRVPKPFSFGADYLLLEDLQPATRAAAYWESFGRRLAALHRHVAPRFGFDHDNYLGSTPQPNAWTDDGYEFFAEHRIRFQVRLARDAGLMERADHVRAEAFATRLPDLVPPQPASLIHGDLWSGNAISDSAGEPAMIDPAAHYGWAEAELAMTALFGEFPTVFYTAYLELHTLDPGWRERFPLYNLYHLLNHLNLFGTSYLDQVQATLRRYAA